jgi:hypothetical protein
MDESNPYGNQAMHFVGWMENLNATNFAYNCKNCVPHLK